MLVPSANDAAEALALHVGKGSTDRFVALMNAKGDELGLVDTNFENPHGLDDRGHVSSARDATVLVRYALGVPFIRDALDRSTVVAPGRKGLPDDGRPARELACSRRRKDRTHTGGGLVAGRGCQRQWRNGLRHRARKRDPQRSQRCAAGAAGVRARAVPARRRDRRGTRLCRARRPATARARVELVAPRAIVRTLRIGTSLVERVVAPSSVALPVRKGQRLGPGRGLRREPARRVLATSWQLGPWPSPACSGRRGGMRRGPPRTCGVSSRDRHRHRQRRARPHADRARLPDRLPPPLERGPHARGRQGDQRRACAEAPRRARSSRPASPADGPGRASSRS